MVGFNLPLTFGFGFPIFDYEDDNYSSDHLYSRRKPRVKIMKKRKGTYREWKSSRTDLSFKQWRRSNRI